MASVNPQVRGLLLFEKAHANLQRRRRETLLSSLRSDLASILVDCPCIYTPEADRVIRCFLPISQQGIGGDSKPRDGYVFTEMSRQESALGTVEKMERPDAEKTGYLLLLSPSVLAFQGKQFWVPEQPVFIVNFLWALSELESLWSYAGDFIALVSEDLATGVIIDNFCGQLAADPSPDEIVYEVAVWPSVTLRES